MFMFGSSIMGGGMMLMEYLYPSSPGAARSGNVEGYYWCVDQLTATYQKYNPSKVAEVPALCTKYKGKERKLLTKVRRKYQK